MCGSRIPSTAFCRRRGFLGGASEEDLNELAAQAIAKTVKTSAAFFSAGVSMKFAINIDVETLAKLPVAILVEKHRPPDDQWPGLVFDVTETQVLTKTALLKSRSRRASSSRSVARDRQFRTRKLLVRNIQGAAVLRAQDRPVVRAGLRRQSGQCECLQDHDRAGPQLRQQGGGGGDRDREDVRKLVELGCDSGQGYLFAKPMTEQELMGMVMAARGAASTGAQASDQGIAKAAAG